MEGAAVALRALEAELRRDPAAFEFFQAVLHLERLRPDRAPVGRAGDPAAVVARFAAHHSIAFPPGEIRSLELDDDGGPARLRLNFFGLTGPLGVLPYHYTGLAAARAGNPALASFLDLFHHRLVSLFYRAWKKNRVTATSAGEEDRLREHLLDLVGMGLGSFRRGLGFEENALAYYAGLLSGHSRSAAALQQLVADYFSVPVAVEQFVGAWHPLPPRDQCEIGEENGASSRLGRGAVVGDEVWDPQSRVRLRVGPLARAEYDRFLPTGDAYDELRALTRFFGDGQYEFELQLVLAAEEVPGCVLGEDDGEAPRPLGWSTWIRSTPATRDADETILRL